MENLKGLARSELFFRTKGLPFFKEKFPELFPRLAFGLAGHGSECFGFDDALSQDHDFTRGFALWLSDEDEERYGYELARAYTLLLKNEALSPAGKSSMLGETEHGVCRIARFYERHIGLPRAPRSWQEWLHIPSYAFAEAVNGKVFLDNSGAFSSIRSAVAKGMPEDVRLKKISSRLAVMAQTGQYNYARCLRRGEKGAAGLALAEFVKNAAELVFLLNKVHAPYYKWLFRAMKELPGTGELAYPLEFLLTDPASPGEKEAMIEDICCALARELASQGLADARGTYLEEHAFEVMRRIKDPEIRSLHVMEG